VVTRVEVVNKILSNTFLATIVANTLSNHIADELNAFADALTESGDEFSQVAGIRRAAKIVQMKQEQE
jgi:hypothetical protein